MRVLVTRPQAEAQALARLLRVLGHVPVACPLLDIRYISASIDLDGVQALLFTSGAGVRAFARLEPHRELPVFAVGDATAAMAREAGFTTVHSAEGDGDALVQAVAGALDPKHGAVLHPAGLQVAGDPGAALAPRGFAYRRLVLYEAIQAVTLPEEGQAALATGALEAVLFFSPRTAEAFVSLVAKAGLVDRCRSLGAYCLSGAVAAPAVVLPWSALHTAPAQNQQSLLALLPPGNFRS